MHTLCDIIRANWRFLSLIFGICLIPSACGLSFEGGIDTGIRVIYINKFGFQSGGFVDMTVTTDAPISFVILGCAQPDVEKNVAGFCAVNSTCPYSWAVFNATADGRLQHNATIPVDDLIYFYLINCDGVYASLYFEVLFMNPDGEQLSTEFLPLPYLYMVAGGLWLVGTIFWLSNWMIYKRRTVPLHKTITVFPLTKLIWCGIAVLYWKTLSIEGTTSDGILAGYYVVLCVSKIVFYGCLLLISYGWCITQPALGRQKFIIPLATLAVAGSLLLGSLLNGYFLLISFVMYVLVLVLVFRGTNRNVRALERQIANPDHDPADHFKLKAYIAFILCSVMLDVLFLANYKWVVEVLDETLELIMFIVIGWLFRLSRDNTLYFKIKVVRHITDKERQVIEKYTKDAFDDDDVEIDDDLVVTSPSQTRLKESFP
eukprot:TRINITY_DN2266_c0_g1_i1.p1 TRINITY_DN2266_c0_g1~~TRINITY_DN2266_c0_g1_i1.p1  ORF type:complete len:430 (-),score=33.43 TRINITY_DN2266_c0_g1_i1:71-1360(-)